MASAFGHDAGTLNNSSSTWDTSSFEMLPSSRQRPKGQQMHSVWVAHLPKVSLPIGKQQFADLVRAKTALARLRAKAGPLEQGREG